MMSLFTATLIVGLWLIMKGGFMLWNPPVIKRYSFWALRSKGLALTVYGTAVTWFLYEISTLSEADFGEYKMLLFLLFSVVAILAWFYVPDFIIFRGEAVLLLLLSKVFLDAAYMQPQASRLFLVSFIYFIILLSLVIGTLPYLVRDFVEWLFEKESHVKLIGSLLGAYGVLLTIIAFTY